MRIFKRLAAFGLAALLVPISRAAELPNILWITSEDNGPQLGCYGDTYATTPNLDALAARSLVYLNAWSTAPVCAPARTAIISGVYPPSSGAEHMRSMTRLPRHMKMYPQFLRELGYYCTNNSKEDYNLQKQGDVWHVSSGKGHWKNRKPGQPFFAIFNHTVSHESQIRRRPHKAVHDPAKVRVRAYHPDTPEVRQDWAQYYDKLTEMDQRVGRNLKELEEAGLADDTIVIYFGDHGSGMPRSKRWPYNSGLHVPLIVHVPEKFKHLAPPEYRAGGRTDRLVGFIDLAPTLLSIAGKEAPDWMQGHAFMGAHAAPDQPFIYGFRGRMDERYDMIRSVRDKRYIYIRNYMPHKVYGQHVSYMFQTPTTRVWKQLYDEGKLKPPATHFWETKPAEELYDLKADPDEVNNLAGSPEHQAVLRRLRTAQRKLARDIRDVGFLPEGEIHARASQAGVTPYEMGHDPKAYPFGEIFTAADLASSLKPEVVPELISLASHKDSAVRYWAVQGLLMRRLGGEGKARETLRRSLKDSSGYVRVVAADALARHGQDEDLEPALQILKEASVLKDNSVFVVMLAMNAIDQLDEKAAPLLAHVQKNPAKGGDAKGRVGGYVGRLKATILSEAKK